MNTSQEFERALTKFRAEVSKNTQELEEKVNESRKLESEIATWQKGIMDNKQKIERLKPEIRRLELEKVKHHGEIMQLEQQNRAHINEHLTDQTKKIHPSHF